MAILAGFTATLLYGGWLTLHGQLAVGAFSVLVFLTQRLLWPLTGLAEVADMYQRSMAAIERAAKEFAAGTALPDTRLRIRNRQQATVAAHVARERI